LEALSYLIPFGKEKVIISQTGGGYGCRHTVPGIYSDIFDKYSGLYTYSWGQLYFTS